MDATEAARREAERLHRANVAAGGDPTRPLAFALQEATSRGLDVYALQEGDSQLKGGKATFDSQAGGILYEDCGSDFERAFLIAHELGHVVLEGGTLAALRLARFTDRATSGQYSRATGRAVAGHGQRRKEVGLHELPGRLRGADLAFAQP